MWRGGRQLRPAQVVRGVERRFWGRRAKQILAAYSEFYNLPLGVTVRKIAFPMCALCAMRR